MYQLNEEEGMILSMVESVCEDVIADRTADIDEADEFPQDIYDLLVEQGLFGLAMPEEYGGFAVSVHCWERCVARLAQESPTVAFLLFVSAIGSDALVRYGSDEQKAAYLPDIISGEKKISFALTEPNAGSDVWSLTTSAKQTDNGFVINGNKIFISNAEVADYFCVFAQVKEDDKTKPSCFIVPREAAGVSVSSHEQKLGLHGSPTCPLAFENVEVGTDALIGEVGQAIEISFHALNRARIALAACALGISKASLKASAEYAQSRRQFETLVWDFQSIANMLADMQVRVQASELLIDAAVEAFINGDRDVKTRVAQAKLYCTEAAQKSAIDAVQIHGGYGFCKEYPVERYYRDVKALTILGGTNQVQRKLIADDVKKAYAL